MLSEAICNDCYQANCGSLNLTASHFRYAQLRDGWRTMGLLQSKPIFSLRWLKTELSTVNANRALSLVFRLNVAMITYNTGSSGFGADVGKVASMAQEKRSDLVIDCPRQYDAASVANVFIYSDLKIGNTTYKAVQRSVAIVSIAPKLQGMIKPVNDLFRGVLVDDIVYTTSFTAMQVKI